MSNTKKENADSGEESPTGKSNMTSQYIPADKFTEVINAEKEKYVGDNPITGLAISGGGIRSASFGMGVLQGLVANDALKYIDYLSTVSGGGYIGSSLTWFLESGLTDGRGAGTTKENFPFGNEHKDNKENVKTDQFILDYIRQHGNYLTPSGALGTLSLVAVVLRSLVLSLLFYTALLTAGMVVLKLAFLFDNPLKLVDWKHCWCWFNLLLGLSALGFGFFLLGVVLSPLLSLFKSNYPFLIKAQEWGGIVLKLSLAFMLIGLVPVLYHNVDLIKDWILQITGASTLTGVIMGYFQHQRQLANKPASSKFENLKIMASAGLTLFGLLLLSFHLSEYFFIDHGFELLLSDQVLTWHKIHILYLLILIILIVGLGFVTNLNHIGFHRMYRNRLMELFMADKGNIINNQWGKAESANSGELTNMCDKNKRPYHIINTNVVLDDSENAKYHNRGGDNFIMSPLYTGSEATGWRETEDFIRLKKSLSGDETQGLTLATAMAISGAAVNPSAGPNSSGITRSKLISILLGVLNLRLGYWAPNPNRIVSGSKANQRPDLFYPGLKGVLGISQTEKKKWIELTDGGHFENLALYELIRRRLKLIIVSDGGADEKFTFEDLANAMEKVRVDFNAKIEFLKDCAPLEDLVPKGLKKWAGKFNLAKRGYALGKITYPPKIGDSKNEYGLLVYIKTTLIDGLPADVYGYKMANPSFPDQTTGDQFFDEVQLEAYRELGYQLVKRLFNDEELKKKLKVKKSDQMTLDDLKRLV